MNEILTVKELTKGIGTRNLNFDAGIYLGWGKEISKWEPDKLEGYIQVNNIKELEQYYECNTIGCYVGVPTGKAPICIVLTENPEV